MGGGWPCHPSTQASPTGRMGQTSIERLRDYLVQLPPQSQALLMREFERAIERGEDTTVATFVLEQLRQIVRGSEDETRPRVDDPARLLFRPLEPFLIEGNVTPRPGQIRRSSLLPVWQWLNRDGAPEQAREFETALQSVRAGASSSPESAVRKFQPRRRGRHRQDRHPDTGRQAARAVPRRSPNVIEDLLPIGSVLQAPRGARQPRRPVAQLFARLRGLADRHRQRRAQRALVANPAGAAVRLVAGHAPADGALADHPSRNQDGGLRRRNPRRRHPLRELPSPSPCTIVLSGREPADGHQAGTFRQRRRSAQDPA